MKNRKAAVLHDQDNHSSRLAMDFTLKLHYAQIGHLILTANR